MTSESFETTKYQLDFKVSPDLLHGLNVVVSDYLPTKRVQFRFPRSKKKRIRKKWAKQPRNWKAVHDGTAYQIGNTLIVSPVVYAELAKRMGEASEKRLIESLGMPAHLLCGNESAPSCGSSLADIHLKSFERIMAADLRAWLSWKW